MNHRELEQILLKCGVYNGKTHTWDTVDLIPPEQWNIPSIYIKINSTATKGTIGRIIGFDDVSRYGCTFILEIDGRKQPSRIKSYYTQWMESYTGGTNYVRTVNTHTKVVVKNPVNKYKQELQKDDWIIGVTSSKKLVIGQVSRWTNHNVWAVRNGAEKEIKMDCIRETFLMPNNEHTKSLTWAAMKGYKGT